MRGLGIVLTDGPGVDVVAAVKGVSACSGGKRLCREQKHSGHERRTRLAQLRGLSLPCKAQEA